MKIEEAKAAQVAIQRAVGNVNHLIQHTGVDVQLEIIQQVDCQVLVAKCYVEPTALDSETALISGIKAIMEEQPSNQFETGAESLDKMNRIGKLIAKST